MTTGRKHTPEERARLASRILKLAAERPPLTRAIIAQRVGVGPNFVSTVLREARVASEDKAAE
jgi:transposase-like protein